MRKTMDLTALSAAKLGLLLDGPAALEELLGVIRNEDESNLTRALSVQVVGEILQGLTDRDVLKFYGLDVSDRMHDLARQDVFPALLDVISEQDEYLCESALYSLFMIGLLGRSNVDSETIDRVRSLLRTSAGSSGVLALYYAAWGHDQDVEILVDVLKRVKSTRREHVAAVVQALQWITGQKIGSDVDSWSDWLKSRR